MNFLDSYMNSIFLHDGFGLLRDELSFQSEVFHSLHELLEFLHEFCLAT